MKKKYNTRDVYLAATLLALGAKLDTIDRTDPKHQVFHFSSEEDNIEADAEAKSGQILKLTRGVDFECVERDYTNGELMINVVKFKEAIQRMKSLIHSNSGS